VNCFNYTAGISPNRSGMCPNSAGGNTNDPTSYPLSFLLVVYVHPLLPVRSLSCMQDSNIFFFLLLCVNVFIIIYIQYSVLSSGHYPLILYGFVKDKKSFSCKIRKFIIKAINPCATLWQFLSSVYLFLSFCLLLMHINAYILAQVCIFIGI